MFLGLLDPDPDPLVRGTYLDPADPELDPDPADPEFDSDLADPELDPVPADPELDPYPDPLGRGTDPRIRIRTKVTRIPNTAYVKLIFFVHIVALCGQEAAKIIMKHENRLLAG
jgi:hypothetical protein